MSTAIQKTLDVVYLAQPFVQLGSGSGNSLDFAFHAQPFAILENYLDYRSGVTIRSSLSIANIGGVTLHPSVVDQSI